MKIKNDIIIFFVLILGSFFLLTLDFWFPSQDKAIVAVYDKDLVEYKIYYEIDNKIDHKPSWIVKSFPPLNKLYITDFGKTNWRLVEEQISSIKENTPHGRIESDLLENILNNHKTNKYLESISYRVVPTGLKQLRKWLDRNILK